jgi:hypothetical protein
VISTNQKIVQNKNKRENEKQRKIKQEEAETSL